MFHWVAAHLLEVILEISVCSIVDALCLPIYQPTCLSVRSKYGAKSSSGLDRKSVGLSKLFINAVTFGQ